MIPNTPLHSRPPPLPTSTAPKKCSCPAHGRGEHGLFPLVPTAYRSPSLLFPPSPPTPRSLGKQRTASPSQRMGKGSGRASEAGLFSAAAFPSTSKTPNPEFLAVPATLGTSLCSGGLWPAHQDGKKWLGRRKISPWVSVLGATLSTLSMKPLGHALLLLPSCPPEHPDTNAATPNSWRQAQGVTPKSPGSAPPIPGWAGGA